MIEVLLSVLVHVVSSRSLACHVVVYMDRESHVVRTKERVKNNKSSIVYQQVIMNILYFAFVDFTF